MTISSTSWRILLFCVAVGGLGIASCGHPSTGGATGTGGATDCTPGTELCTCMTGSTCNSGLQCADDVNKCVTVAGGGTGGSGDSSGTGGSVSGTGGSVSTGGSAATGGASGGAGGTHATGGVGGGSGGSATGGSNGTGGAGGPNLVTNGDLSSGDTGWNVGQGSPTSMGVVNGAYCATFSKMTVLIGWGNMSVAANLTSGSSYTLSYQVSASDPSTTLEIHVGQAVSPYNADTSSITADNPTTSLTTFSKTFMSTANDTTAGIAFLFSSNASNVTACVDNVVLTKN